LRPVDLTASTTFLSSQVFINGRTYAGRGARARIGRLAAAAFSEDEITLHEIDNTLNCHGEVRLSIAVDVCINESRCVILREPQLTGFSVKTIVADKLEGLVATDL